MHRQSADNLQVVPPTLLPECVSISKSDGPDGGAHHVHTLSPPFRALDTTLLTILATSDWSCATTCPELSTSFWPSKRHITHGTLGLRCTHPLPSLTCQGKCSELLAYPSMDSLLTRLQCVARCRCSAHSHARGRCRAPSLRLQPQRSGRGLAHHAGHPPPGARISPMCPRGPRRNAQDGRQD